MSMGSILAALRRRKVLTVLGLLLTFAAAYLGASRTGSSYSYTSSSLLLPPAISAHVPLGTVDYTRGNPLFFLSNLNQSRDILIGALTAENRVAAVTRRFPGVQYTVEPDVLGSSPVVVITTTGTSESATLRATHYLNDQLPAVLTQLQVGLGIQRDALITVHSLTQDQAPSVSHKGQVRQGITAAGGMGLLTMFGIALIDGMAMSRRKEPRQGPPPGPSQEAPERPRRQPRQRRGGAQREPKKPQEESADDADTSDAARPAHEKTPASQR